MIAEIVFVREFVRKLVEVFIVLCVCENDRVREGVRERVRERVVMWKMFINNQTLESPRSL